MEINLENTTILLTGATGGIGEAMAIALAKSGATIAIHYRSDDDKAHSLEKDLGNNSKAFYADLSQHQEVEKLFDEVIAFYRKIDVLINNAGVFIYSPLEGNDSWLEQWNKTMNINLTAAGILSKKAIHHFKERNGGRIIHIASRAAFRGDTENHLAYAASKGGMVSLSRSIARANGKDNIKSFVIAPGFVQTKMAAPYIKEVGESSLANETALKKLTQPKDLAPLAVLLCSGMMDHATGSSIDVNAGSYVR